MRAQGFWFLGAAALTLAIGCAADRPVPEESERTAVVAPAPAPAPAARPAQVFPTPAPTIGARPRTQLPAPVAMPGGGIRIDMRGTAGHVRALERQPDGKYRHVCVDAPETAQGLR
jgi:hypothetical protein